MQFRDRSQHLLDLASLKPTSEFHLLFMQDSTSVKANPSKP